MPDREKVIKAIETHLSTDISVGCDDCTYENDGWCTTRVLTDALALLKEQEERIETLESLRRIEQEGRWKFTQIGENNKQIVNNGSIVMDFRKRKGEGKDDSN